MQSSGEQDHVGERPQGGETGGEPGRHRAQQILHTKNGRMRVVNTEWKFSAFLHEITLGVAKWRK